MNTLICPISKERTNRSVVRITGFLVASTVVLYALTGNIYLIFALGIDFYIRAFGNSRYSIFAFLASKISRGLNLKVISIDKAPKIFASRVGFLFSVAIVALYFVSPISSLIVSLILMSFALLESILNFCVGCVVYTYLVLPFYRKSHA